MGWVWVDDNTLDTLLHPPHIYKAQHNNTKERHARTSTVARLLDDADAETLPGLAYTRCHDPFTAASKSKAGAAAVLLAEAAKAEEGVPVLESVVVEGAGGERYCFCFGCGVVV